MATHPTLMKMRLAAINRITTEFPRAKAGMSTKDAHVYWGQRDIVDQIRQIINNPPKGYMASKPSLKSQAKARFLQWRENQAKGEWKTLTEAEQALWEGYVSEGVEFGEIRARELARDEPVKAGDRIVLVSDVSYLGDEWPKGAAGEVRFIVHDHVSDLDMCFVEFDLDLYSLNVHLHEIKKEA